MILFVLIGGAPAIVVLSLVVMCYLAGYELSKEDDLPFLIKAWWVLLVLILNVIGFGIFWIWLAVRRVRRAA
jgi:uncharacterized BrkB/YihY/UPF0761 family membrane protein